MGLNGSRPFILDPRLLELKITSLKQLALYYNTIKLQQPEGAIFFIKIYKNGPLYMQFNKNVDPKVSIAFIKRK